MIDDADIELRFGNDSFIDYERFCAWQQRFNSVNDQEPGHSDVALLFTSRTIQLRNGPVQGVRQVFRLLLVLH